jgi:membrane protease YdiL (CAAX protease family)
MNPFDETPQNPPNSQSDAAEKGTSDEHSSTGAEVQANESPVPAALYPGMIPPLRPTYPEDLQITWSWPHFLLFLFFGFISLVFVQGILAVHYVPHHQRMSPKQLEQYLLSKPQFAIGSMLIWYAVIFFFLYVTLSVLRGHSFWKCLGWRQIQPKDRELPKNPIIYFFAGCGLSLFVALLTARMKPPENVPIEELFKYRETALLFMVMAVLVAPLVEETLFRGYLYPLFARSFGIVPGIALTGMLFGAMHGSQLGWTWSLVSVLVAVGVIFTLVRARTGSVFASYMMHLGYNSLIAVAAMLSTHGFTRLPAGP